MNDTISKKYKFWLIILLFIHALLFIWAVAEQTFCLDGRQYVLLADDAMISMKYAWNLVHNGELVWQSGNRVMGITNPGWTLIMASTMLFGLPLRISAVPVLCINLLINLAILWIIFLIIQKKYGLFCAFASTGWLTVSIPLLFWSVHGFETPLQTLLITLALIPLFSSESKKIVWSPIWLTLAFIVRPDALVLLMIFPIVSLLLGTVPQNRKKNFVRAIIISGIVVILSIIAHRLYYGDWLPNTYYLKATNSAKSLTQGFSYLAETIWVDGILPILGFAIIGVIFGIRQKVHRKKIVAISILSIIWISYIIWTGGDAFPHSRFLLPILPIIIFIAAAGLHFILQWISLQNLSLNKYLSTKQAIICAMIFLILGFSYFWAVSSLDDFYGPDTNRVDRASIAESLRELGLPENTIIATFEAGTIPFLLPRFRYADLLGKNDRHIARTKAHPGLVGHNKWDFDYSLGKIRPDIIVTRDNYANFTDRKAFILLENADKLPPNSVFFPVALWVHPLFKQHYRDNQIQITTPFDTHWVYGRK